MNLMTLLKPWTWFARESHVSSPKESEVLTPSLPYQSYGDYDPQRHQSFPQRRLLPLPTSVSSGTTRRHSPTSHPQIYIPPSTGRRTPPPPSSSYPESNLLTGIILGEMLASHADTEPQPQTQTSPSLFEGGLSGGAGGGSDYSAPSNDPSPSSSWSSSGDFTGSTSYDSPSSSSYDSGSSDAGASASSGDSW